MKRISVNGNNCVVVPFRGRPLEPGMTIGQRYGRRVYRVLCFDGDDVIVRNVRTESIVMAFSQREVLEEFGVVEPA